MRISDWSSDVCSSDLGKHVMAPNPHHCAEVGRLLARLHLATREHILERASDRGLDWMQEQGPSLDRKSVVEGKSVSVRVDLGGPRIIKKKRSSAQHKTYIKSHSTHAIATRKNQ